MIKRFLPFLACLTLLGCALPQLQSPALPFNTGAQLQPQDTQVEEDAGRPSSASGSVRIDEHLLPTGALELGNPDAPVSILLFTNHSCAYCRSFYEDLIMKLRDDYIRTNIVRVDIIHFTLNKYPDSNQSAALLMCAAWQGKGAAMHDLLLQQSIKSGTNKISLENLGIDKTAFDACLKGDDIQAAIASQQSFARSLGVLLVPTYFINGTKYVGLPEYADLKGQIEDALQATK